MSDRIVDNVSGSLWGSHPPRRKREETIISIETPEDRKNRYLNNIMGELEAYLQRPGEEWDELEEGKIIDMLDAVNNTVKAQLSSNNEEYTG